MMFKSSLVIAFIGIFALLSTFAAAGDGVRKKGKKKGGGKKGHKESKCRGFSKKDIEGTYGFSAQGFVIPPPTGEPLNAVSLGILGFYRDGSRAFTIAANGESPGGFTPPTVAESCHFDLHSNGLGTILIEDHSLNGFTGTIPLSFVVVAGGNEIRFIRTDIVGIAEGVATRQNACKD